MADHANAKPGPPRKRGGPSRGPNHPLTRFVAVILHLPNYSRLAWSLLRDERVSRAQKATLLAGVGYLAMPVDLVPGIIPVAGQLDDLTAILLALRAVVRSLPPEAATTHLQGAGLTASDIDRDLRTLGITAAWLVYRGGALAVSALGVAASGIARGLRFSLGKLSRRGTSSAASRKPPTPQH